MNNLSNEELVQVHATAREALLPVVWTEKKALAHFKSKITPGVVEAMARELLALREAQPATHSVNDDMALAFCHAISDSSVGSDELEDVKAGLRAALANYAALQLPAVPDGWIPLDEQSPYDAPYKIPADIRELIAEEIGILFSEEDAQAMWNICRVAMIAAAPKQDPAVKK